MFYEWFLNQVHTIDFVLVDSNNSEVSGLGTSFTLELRKAGGTFQASAGVKAEIADGWYSYTNIASEADTTGLVDIKVTGAGIVQQNLLAKVITIITGVQVRDYQVVDPNSNPIMGALVWITSDIAGNSVIWTGTSNALGYAVDLHGIKPYLPNGTFYYWRKHTDYNFTNPDTEVYA